MGHPDNAIREAHPKPLCHGLQEALAPLLHPARPHARLALLPVRGPQGQAQHATRVTDSMALCSSDVLAHRLQPHEVLSAMRARVGAPVFQDVTNDDQLHASRPSPLMEWYERKKGSRMTWLQHAPHFDLFAFACRTRLSTRPPQRHAPTVQGCD